MADPVPIVLKHQRLVRCARLQARPPEKPGHQTEAQSVKNWPGAKRPTSGGSPAPRGPERSRHRSRTTPATAPIASPVNKRTPSGAFHITIRFPRPMSPIIAVATISAPPCLRGGRIRHDRPRSGRPAGSGPRQPPNTPEKPFGGRVVRNVHRPGTKRDDIRTGQFRNSGKAGGFSAAVLPHRYLNHSRRACSSLQPSDSPIFNHRCGQQKNTLRRLAPWLWMQTRWRSGVPC